MNNRSSFTDQAWAATADIRAAIDDHPFLTSLRAGTLDRAVFVEYLTQDSHYLIGYARALALCASQADETDDISFWASAAHYAVVVERTLHANWISEPDPANVSEPSPTCRSYLDFLLATAGQGSYPVLAAALTPCFWIYEDVGSRLTVEVLLDGHPYADWIQTYGDPAFAEATERVKGIINTLAECCSQDVRDRMLAAFRTAARYEWMFWDAAWRREPWPEFGPAARSQAGRPAL
jgi:thiaminase (transcriptional activator TenA)